MICFRISQLDLLGKRIGRIIAAFAAISIAVFWMFTQLVDPAPFYSAYDPELQHMMNSLAAFKGVSYLYVHHPGTPVQILGTIILGLTLPITDASRLPFVEFHLLSPGVFLTLARGAIALLSLVTFALLTIYAMRRSRWSDSLVAIGASIVYFAIHPLAIRSLILWSHNSFSFAVGSLYLLGVFVLIRSRPRPHIWQIALVGAGAGILTAIQIYYMAWIAGAVVTMLVLSRLEQSDDRRFVSPIIAVIIGSVLGFVVATSPIIGQYPRIARWMWALLAHQGRYGSGMPGITSASVFLGNLRLMINQAPELIALVSIILILFAVLYLTRPTEVKANAALTAMAAGLSVQLLATIGLVGKHPGLIYLLSAAGTLPILSIAVFGLIPTRSSNWNRARAILAVMFVGFILVGFVRNLSSASKAHRATVLGLEDERVEIERKLHDISSAAELGNEQPTVLWTYGTHSPCYALSFGDEWAGGVFTNELDKICPSDFQLNVWSGRVWANGMWKPVGEFRGAAVISREEIVDSYNFLLELGNIISLPVDTFGYAPMYGQIVLIADS